METVSGFILGGSKITADGDCSHEIRRRLLLGRGAMTNLDNVLKSRHLSADKGPYSQVYGLPRSCTVVTAGPERRQSAKELMPLNCGAGEDS